MRPSQTSPPCSTDRGRVRAPHYLFHAMTAIIFQWLSNGLGSQVWQLFLCCIICMLNDCLHTTCASYSYSL